jgi:hypothetical protein
MKALGQAARRHHGQLGFSKFIFENSLRAVRVDLMTEAWAKYLGCFHSGIGSSLRAVTISVCQFWAEDYCPDYPTHPQNQNAE